MNGKHLWARITGERALGWEGKGVQGQSSLQVCEGERGALHS